MLLGIFNVRVIMVFPSNAYEMNLFAENTWFFTIGTSKRSLKADIIERTRFLGLGVVEN